MIRICNLINERDEIIGTERNIVKLYKVERKDHADARWGKQSSTCDAKIGGAEDHESREGQCGSDNLARPAMKDPFGKSPTQPRNGVEHVFQNHDFQYVKKTSVVDTAISGFTSKEIDILDIGGIIQPENGFKTFHVILEKRHIVEAKKY